MITTVVFHARIAKNPTPSSLTAAAGPWRWLVAVLYASSILIMVRSVFRMIEFGMGFDSVLLSTEAYLLALDGALMFAATAALLWCHPSRVLLPHRHRGNEGPALLLTSVGSGSGSGGGGGGGTTDDSFGTMSVQNHHHNHRHHASYSSLSPLPGTPRTTPGKSDRGSIMNQRYDEYKTSSPSRPRYSYSQDRYVNRG